MFYQTYSGTFLWSSSHIEIFIATGIITKYHSKLMRVYVGQDHLRFLNIKQKDSIELARVC